MKHLLMVTYSFPPLSLAGTFRPMKFTKYLPDYGWHTSVITLKGWNSLPKDYALLNEINAHTKVYPTKTIEFLSRHHKHRKYSFLDIGELFNMINGAISIPDPLIYWIPSIVRQALHIQKQKKIDAIFTTSPPHSLHLAGMLLKHLLKAPLVSDFRDPWVDNLHYYAQKSSVKIQIEKWLENRLILGADSIISNTPENREKLLKRYSFVNNRERISTITNGFDDATIGKIVPKKFNRFTLCHIGALYSVSRPEFVFESLLKWINENSDRLPIKNNFHFILVGSVNEEIKHIVAKDKLERYVTFIGRVPHEEALSMAKGADALLVNMGFKEIAKGWIPLKLFDYLGARRPIIAVVPPCGEIARIISKTGSGYCITEADHFQFSNLLNILFKNYINSDSRAADREVNASELNSFEIRTLTEKLASTLDQLTLKDLSNRNRV